MMDAKLSQRRLNPVVDRYVTTDLPIQEIVANSGSSDTPMLRAIVMLADCLDGRALARDALAAAKAVPLKGADPELAALMLSRWAELACRFAQPSEGDALLHQVRALISDTTHPEIRAAVLHTRAALADMRGSQADREQALRDILTVVAEHSPRRKYYVWELGMLLAQQGRGAEFRMELSQLTWHCNERFTTDRVYLIQFINAIETGRIQEASELMPKMAATLPPNQIQRRVLYREYQELLTLMHASVTRHASRDELVMPPRPVWVQTVYHLLRGDTTEALKSARLETRHGLQSLVAIGFPAYNLVRGELASGNWEAAKRVLSMRRTRGNAHYLDDFFLARCEWLAQNRQGAATHFAEALAASERHESRPRLDFELRLAVELSPGDTLELMRRAATIGAATPAAVSPAAPVAARPPDPEIALRVIVGHSRVIQGIRDTVQRFANLDAAVLITGETGTGKDLIARAMHAAGPRRSRPYIAVNCGSITETLLESELFGHERGAFTGADRANPGLFEEAGNGTIYLDEIGEISPRLQTALLRVLESGEIRAIGCTKSRLIHCRVIAATNADLGAGVAAGTFRRDLLYRLERLCIHIPPLRERREDIMLLARQFLDEGRPFGTHTTVSRTFTEAVRAYDWPGNVRELRNAIERMRLTHSDKLEYTLADLDIRLATPAPTPAPAAGREPHIPTPDAQDASRTASTATPAPAAAAGAALSGHDASELIRLGTSALRRQDHLRDLFEKHGKLTRTEVTQILGVSPNTATKYLKDLCDEGFIERIEPSASTRSHYFTLRRRPGGPA